ncbi:MAG: hypothetical protein ACREM3_07640 [Candidatus Rokuibacteriota bacterium]
MARWNIVTGITGIVLVCALAVGVGAERLREGVVVRHCGAEARAAEAALIGFVEKRSPGSGEVLKQWDEKGVLRAKYDLVFTECLHFNGFLR